MRPELAQYEGRYPRLFEDMRVDWSQLERANAIRGALDLTEATGGEPFRADAPPQYFTGDLDASFVLVQLNPKRHDQRWARRLTGSSFEEWVLAQRWFGRDHYGPGAPPWPSPFDRKLVRFVRPFGVIDFDTPTDDGRPLETVQLERVVDKKLQLELVPYASPDFRTGKVRRATALLDAHVERVVSVIAATQRDYVIFCGAIFERLLAARLVERHDHETCLKKRDGTVMRDRSRFSSISLRTSERTISAGIAQSWARQGMPMESYAEWILALWPSATNAAT